MTALNVTLSDLIPFADYRVSVKCIPLIEYAAGPSPRGYWSNAVLQMFSTQPDGTPVVMLFEVKCIDYVWHRVLHLFYLSTHRRFMSMT